MSDRVSTRILVVGAGPCGLAVGAAARRAGVECTLVDKGPIVSSIERYPIGMSFFSTADHLEVEDVPFVVARDNPTRSEALKYYRRVVKHFELDVRQYETVDSVERSNGSFYVQSRHLTGATRSYLADAVVVATGYFDTPNLLEVPGEDLPKVTHYFRDPHLYFDQDVLVVGGGNSAVEAALTTWRAGARVTMAHLFEAKHRVEQVEPGRVLLRDLQEETETWLANDFVLAMTGFRPDPGLLRDLGVKFDPTTGIPSHDPTSMETDVPGVYIAGVLAAGFDANKIFIQNGREHGAKIVRRFVEAQAETPGR